MYIFIICCIIYRKGNTQRKINKPYKKNSNLLTTTHLILLVIFSINYHQQVNF